MPDNIPDGFWGQIDHQLDRIASQKPDTFDGVRAILSDPRYVHIAAYSDAPTDSDAAFFAGSGGDRTLLEALRAAGWGLKVYLADYYYSMSHPTTEEIISYVEGDVLRGHQLLE